MTKIFLTISLMFILLHSDVYAYIDPGTGGIILQAIIGFLAALGATITVYWKKFKEIIKKIFKIKNKID